MFQRQSPKTPGSEPQAKSRLYLPPSLRIEVRSPGFSSRLSALIQQGNECDQKRPSPPLRPPTGASNFNPKYTGFGCRPKVSFDRSPLPLLSTNRTSNRIGSGSRLSPRSPVAMIKVAPSTPFAPFRSVLTRTPFSTSTATPLAPTTSSPSTTLSDSITTGSGVADPRRVVVALQELSRSRKRGLNRRFLKCSEDEEFEEDEEEESGSKRARRDSSSSVGSSLSMEMPPLFSNGVIGQTTSHLVSRETDLSLNSLLSRSQSIFGHASKSMNIQQQPQQMNQPTGASKKQKFINNAIQSSLSSSIHMKRCRSDIDSDDSSSDDEASATLNTSKNHISAPGSKQTGENKRQRLANTPTGQQNQPEAGTKKRVSFSPSLGPESGYKGLSGQKGGASATPIQRGPQPFVAKKLVLPTMSEIIGGKKLSPKKSEELFDEFEVEVEPRKTMITSIQALDSDRAKDKLRADNLLSIFEPDEPVQKALPVGGLATQNPPVIPAIVVDPPPYVAPVSTPSLTLLVQEDKVKDKAPEVQLTSRADKVEEPKEDATKQPSPSDSSAKLPALTSSTATTDLAPTTTTTAPATTTSPFPGFAFGSFPKLPLAESTTGHSSTTVTTTSSDTVSVSSPKSGFNFSFGAPQTTKSVTTLVPSVTTLNPTTTTQIPSSTNPTTTTAAASSVFSFGAPTSSDKKVESTTTPTFSFGSSTVASKTEESNPLTAFGFGVKFGAADANKPFVFGAPTSKPEEKTTSVTTPASTTSTTLPSLFAFGGASGKPPVTTVAESKTTFAFGGTMGEKEKSSPFTFGASLKSSEESKAPSGTAFSFGKEASAPAGPTFSFGKPPGPDASAPPAAPSFSFGKSSGADVNSAVLSTTSATPSLFQFGGQANVVTTTQADTSSMFQFGNSQTMSAPQPAKPAFGFGTTTTAPPTGGSDIFKFGGPAASNTAASAPAFSFASALKSSSASAASSTPSSFQSASTSNLPKSVSLPPFGASSQPSSGSGVFTFGSNAAAAPAPTGVFQFGSSGTPASTAAPQAPSSTSGVFQFGAAAAPPPVSGFGAPAPETNASAGFSFGSAAAINQSFAFGSTPTLSTQGFSFGATAAPPAASFGGIASPPQANSMFSIGTGASTPKGRTIARARRTKR